MKKLFGSLAIAILAVGMMMTSCTKEEVWSDVDNFVFENYKNFRDGALGGHHRCYRVIFPVTIVFPDSTTTEVFDREEFVNALKSWKESSPTVDGRPTLEFPFSVMRIDSTVIEVNSEEDIKELKSECREFKNKHRKCKHFGKFLENRCYEVNLPIAIVMADGEVIEINRKRDIAKVLREWKKDRPEEVPEIVFPITVTVKEDNSTLELKDMDAFEALIADCKG